MNVHELTQAEVDSMRAIATYYPMRRYVFAAKREGEETQIWPTFDLRKAKAMGRKGWTVHVMDKRGANV